MVEDFGGSEDPRAKTGFDDLLVSGAGVGWGGDSRGSCLRLAEVHREGRCDQGTQEREAGERGHDPVLDHLLGNPGPQRADGAGRTFPRPLETGSETVQQYRQQGGGDGYAGERDEHSGQADAAQERDVCECERSETDCDG